MPQQKNGVAGTSAAVLLGYFLLIVTGLYEGTLLTKLLIVNTEAPFRSLEALLGNIASGELKFIVTTVDTSSFEKINASSGYEYRWAGIAITMSP